MMGILKNLFNDDGKTKIGINEIADDSGNLLGDLVAAKDVTNTFALQDANGLKAFQIGKLLVIYGSANPSNGWSDLAVTSLKFQGDTSLSPSVSSVSDSSKDIIVTLNSEGLLRCRAGSSFNGNVIFSGVSVLR